jgi:hypothetical protein
MEKEFKVGDLVVTTDDFAGMLCHGDGPERLGEGVPAVVLEMPDWEGGCLIVRPLFGTSTHALARGWAKKVEINE